MNALRKNAEEFARTARLLCDALEHPPAEHEEAALLLLRLLASVYAKAFYALHCIVFDHGLKAER